MLPKDEHYRLLQEAGEREWRTLLAFVRVRNRCHQIKERDLAWRKENPHLITSIEREKRLAHAAYRQAYRATSVLRRPWIRKYGPARLPELANIDARYF